MYKVELTDQEFSVLAEIINQVPVSGDGVLVVFELMKKFPREATPKVKA